jgi:hypothetical protein
MINPAGNLSQMTKPGGFTMKKFSVALLALATVLALTPSAMATPIFCSADTSAIAAGTVCSEGAFTFTFESVSVTAGPGSLYFNGSLTNATNLAFTVVGTYPVDFNFVYLVQGPVAKTTIDNQFISGQGSIAESVCADVACHTILLGLTTNVTPGADVSGSFASTGTFYINKDVNDGGGTTNGFSEFNDSISYAPEPGTLSMFGAGLLGLAGMLRFKFGKAR